MTGPRDDDNELVTQIRGNIRAEGHRFLSLLIAVLIISALFIGIAEFHLPAETTSIVALMVLLAWIALVFRSQSTSQPLARPYDEKLLRKTIDDQHRRWRWIYTFAFILIAAITAMTTFALMQPLADRPLAKSAPVIWGLTAHTVQLASRAGVALDLAIFAVVAAFQVCFGPGFLSGAYRRALNDEHTSALQHSAAMFGYPLSVIAMCAVLCATAIGPQWGVLLMPSAIAAAVILPGIYFLIQQWRSERDG